MTPEANQLIDRLVELTQNGDMAWQDDSDPFSTHHYISSYRAVAFATEWLRDENPHLRITTPGLRSSIIQDRGVLRLIMAIQRRLPRELEQASYIRKKLADGSSFVNLQRDRHTKEVLDLITR